MDFGRVEANVTSLLNLAVTNTGQAVLDIEEFVMTGSEDSSKIAGLPRQLSDEGSDQTAKMGEPGQAFAIEIIYENGSAGEARRTANH